MTRPPEKPAPEHPQGQIQATDLTCLDLFSGCGGFSLGMQRAGFKILAAIDFNKEAVETYQLNFPGVLALREDLTQFRPEHLAAMLGNHPVHVIVGGPPCQGFSLARQYDGANHGRRRLVYDPRRQLYREFLAYVAHFRPQVFVMENVLGIRSAAGGEYLTRVQKEARDLGYRVHGQVEDAWKLGVPQKRRRQLFIGVRADLPAYFVAELKPAPRAHPCVTLGSALGDLPPLEAGEGRPVSSYDLTLRARHLRAGGEAARKYLVETLEIERALTLTGHIARPHSERDLRDFARLREGENSATAMRERGVEFEFPYDKSTFKDRYTRQHREKPCSTIVAHLSKDGLMFIHPTQNRSLTPREAARVQSFPDWFVFPGARTHAFRLIGNAVPPLVAEAVGLAVKGFLKATHTSGVRFAASRGGQVPAKSSAPCDAGRSTHDESAPRTRRAAAEQLERLARLDRRQLRRVPTDEFLQAWHALLFLFPHLHPHNALDHGTAEEEVSPDQLPLPGFESLFTRRYTRSGWPVALALIGEEAWRRLDSAMINHSEFYCQAAATGKERELKTMLIAGVTGKRA